MSEEGGRKNKSANYALELYESKMASETGRRIWFEEKAGFVSVQQALAYAATEKIQGELRVVRIATPIYGGELVTPEPVYSLLKIKTDSKAPTTSRKRGSKAAVAAQESPVASTPGQEKGAVAGEPDEAIPPEAAADLDATP